MKGPNVLRWIVLGALLCLLGEAFAQQATVECRIADEIRLNRENEIKLYRVEQGKMVEKAGGKYTGDGYFAFCFVPEYEGFYVVGEERNYCYPVWVKAGDKVAVWIDRKGGHLYGKKNSKENRVLYEWQELSREVSDMSTRRFMARQGTYEDFFRKLGELEKVTDRFKAEIRTGNTVFDELMKKSVDYEMDYYALNYLLTPKWSDYIWPEVSDYPDYYSRIFSPAKWKEDVVLALPFGHRLLREYVGFAGKMGKTRDTGLEQLIPNDRLRAELALASLEQMRSAFQFERELAKVKTLFSEEQHLRAAEMLKSIRQNNARQKTIDFTYPDVNGKMVSLSDFKGKVVLVDVWATWCNPCREQLPYLKQLEEEMQGTDLVVIGVSLDEKKGYERWRKMVTNGEVRGIQLFAGGFGKIAQDYGITGIPRFMVFDREGKVAEANAPRPSSPELKELIRYLLGK